VKLLFAWQAWLNKLPYWALALLGAVLLSSGWMWPPLTPLIFIGWQPLFVLNNRLDKAIAKRGTFFLYTFLMLLGWNLISTWWIVNSTIGGMLGANIANALLMYIPIAFFRWSWGRVKSEISYLFLAAAFISFEFGHMHWDLSWSWLNLGNVFAFNHHWVQWYQLTGALGGSIWVFAVNILIWHIATSIPNLKKVYILALVTAGPIVISFFMYYSLDPHYGKPTEVVVVQPNMDPYNEKFSIPVTEQIERFIKLSESKLTDSTVWVLWPETCVSELIEEGNIEADPKIQAIRTFLSRHPNVSLLTGATTYITYNRKQTPTARFKEGVGFYDIFNTAIYLKHGQKAGIYHKSMLVPGVEQLPFPELLGVLAIDLGGISGSLGKQETRTVLGEGDAKVAPVICYESIYGGFCSEFIADGANFIGIITNDGWWGNTPGHRHHLAFARLRAIESRKSIARSANTGISAFLNERGDVEQSLDWWQQGALVGKVYVNDSSTFYTQIPDWFGWCVVLALIRLLWIVVFKLNPFSKIQS